MPRQSERGSEAAALGYVAGLPGSSSMASGNARVRPKAEEEQHPPDDFVLDAAVRHSKSRFGSLLCFVDNTTAL